MISRGDIQRLSGSTSYSKGLDIYRSGYKIQKFDVEEKRDTDFIQALVKGSGRNSYTVQITYDKDMDRVKQIYCSCPAFYSYSGICKHCVAVLLEYAEYRADQELLERSVREREALGLGVRRREQSTPVFMKQLLEMQMKKKVAPLLQKKVYGKVKLEPIMRVCEQRSGLQLDLEFKIGIGQMYVVKDVFEFSKNMEQKRDHSYGKKLQFVHIPEAFEEQAKHLVQFLQNWVNANKNRYIQMNSGYGYSYGYGGSPPKLRNIPLSGDDLSEFLELMGDTPFWVYLDSYGEKLWRVSDQKLPRYMTITGQENGINVEINTLLGYNLGRYYVYFEDGLIYKMRAEEQEPIAEFLSCMAEIPERKVFIQKEDVPVFCKELLPTLEKFFVCRKENFQEEDYGVQQALFEIYLDMPQEDFVTCRIMAKYGDKAHNVYERSVMEGRDLVYEIEVSERIAVYFNAYDEKKMELVLADDEEKLYELLTEGILRMQELGEVYISDALKKINIRESPKISVGVSLAGDMLQLRMTAGDMPQETLVEILSKYNKKKKYYRLKNGDFINTDDDGIDAMMELKEGLQLTGRQLRQEEITLPKYHALYLDEELKEHAALPADKDRRFKSLVRNMKTVEDNDFEIPEHMAGILREYQKRGYLWIKTLKHNGFGGILADDMGLGKTLQVITFLCSEFQESDEETSVRCLVVCPSSLIFNWHSELEKFAPELPVTMIAGAAAERRKLIENAGIRDILITSYDLLKRDIEHYKELEFAYQIIDEAQYIKNHGTQAARAVKQVRAGFKLALTGTPVENRLSELWSIFDYLMPGFLYSYERFRKEMELPIVQNQAEQPMKRLQKMIRPFVLRRLKKDVLKDLPDKIEKNMFARLEGEQQKLYDAHVQRLKLLLDKQTDEEFRTSKIQILSELTKLRQLCCDPGLLYEDYSANSAKADMCVELIQNAVNGGHKILLFSQFTTMLEQLQKRFEQENITYYSLRGSTSKEKRNKLVKEFNENDVSVFCISLKAGGTGLNLTAADIVIHYDPWWNLAVQNQATDRAHRIGQKKVVSVYRLIVKDSIEENITKLQEKKKELADQILGGEGMSQGSFSREELLELLT